MMEVFSNNNFGKLWKILLEIRNSYAPMYNNTPCDTNI